jgi:hypothetical protein
MLRCLIVLAGAIFLAALGAGASTAAPRAEQIHIAIDDHFVSDFWSDECGFEVTINLVGDLQVTLVRNADGLIVRENDRIGGAKVTFSSENGSFSFPNQPSQWDYGDGAKLGSPVVVSFPGLQGHVAGQVPSDAGLLRFGGVVEGFDEFGIPEVEFNGVVLKDVGQRSDFEDVRAAICGSLSGT